MTKDTVINREIMISRNGKPLFAVALNPSEKGNEANYVFIENGDVKFASSWLNSIQPFSVGNESHRIAKEIFTEGLRTAIKVKILELKQMESIFHDIGLEDCFGSVLVDNTKLLLEVKNSIVSKNDIVGIVESSIIDVKSSIVSENTIKGAAEEAIAETVQPIALKKGRRPTKIEPKEN